MAVLLDSVAVLIESAEQDERRKKEEEKKKTQFSILVMRSWPKWLRLISYPGSINCESLMTSKIALILCAAWLTALQILCSILEALYYEPEKKSQEN